MVTKTPCRKDCPSRQAGCREYCAAYKQWEIVKKIRYHNKKVGYQDYSTDSHASAERRRLNNRLMGW